MSAADDNFAASVKSIRIRRKPSRRLLLVAAVIVALIAAGAVWLHARAGRFHGPALAAYLE